MTAEGPASQLERFAIGYSDLDLEIHRAVVGLDERQDGEGVTRVALLLNEPADETWDATRIRGLRDALGRKATELGLPPVSVTLVPESEAEFVDVFAR